MRDDNQFTFYILRWLCSYIFINCLKKIPIRTIILDNLVLKVGSIRTWKPFAAKCLYELQYKIDFTYKF